MNAAEFWANPQPDGRTAEQHLVAFWSRMRDCPCAGHKVLPGAGARPAPRPRRRKRRDRDDDVLLFLLR